MSRRASLLAKEQRNRPKVRFPDELVFLDNIKEGDVPAMQSMLRRVSVSIDVNAIASSGMTPLHSAVMEENVQAVRLLTRHGCDINKKDIDSWTPLHAACANGFTEVVKVLLEAGANRNILTEDGERPYDLIDPSDLDTVGIMLAHRDMREAVSEEEEEEGEDAEEEGSEDERMRRRQERYYSHECQEEEEEEDEDEEEDDEEEKTDRRKFCEKWPMRRYTGDSDDEEDEDENANEQSNTLNEESESSDGETNDTDTGHDNVNSDISNGKDTESEHIVPVVSSCVPLKSALKTKGILKQPGDRPKKTMSFET